VLDDGTVLRLARGPGSSPHALGVTGSVDLLGALVEEVGGPADIAVLMLAAIDFPDEEAAYRAEVEPRAWARRTIVGNDTFAVLRAGSERGWGVAVTCGAGINCVGRAPDGRQVRFPSLGAISGDWGGGLDVGLAAVRAAARSEDGRGPRTSLEHLVPAYFGTGSPTDLARALHRGTVAMRRLPELAPLTFAAADDDAVAAGIVDRLADEVVAMARAALTRLDLAGDEVEVVLGGGLLQSGNTRLLGRILDGLRDVAPAALVHPAVSPPIAGAALIGLDELGAGRDAQARLRRELAEAVARLEPQTAPAD